MERDFMGLTVKQETLEETMDSGPMRSSAMQRSFPNKVSAVPQLFSFQGAQMEKPKTGFDSLASSGLVTITTTTEAFNSDQEPYSGVMQLKHKYATYPVQNNEEHGLQEVRVPPVIIQSNQTGSLLTCNPVHQSFVSSAGQSLIRSAGLQPLAVPLTNPVPAVPPNSSVVDTARLRSDSKASGAPAQLTIFYSGSFCVYDNVSPEKAQEIMLLAGNGSPVTSRATVPASPSPIQAPVIPSSVIDEFLSAGGLGSSNDLTAIKPAGAGVTNNVEPLKVVNMIGSVPATFLSSGAVPQSRRKSLIRFLEKRKERAIDASPYISKQSLDSSTPR